VKVRERYALARRSADNELREQNDTLARQFRRAKARNTDAFDQGFDAAVRMLEAGADLEQLRAAQRHQSLGHDDTQPIALPEEFNVDTDVDIRALE
jgi:hypothetical protein